jgi:Kef-type K+ transport system membrane component KefB/nucleotide-binding universal stress UspA family protein
VETFTAAPHDDVLALVVQIAVLLFAARALGWLSQRLGQPSVVGEILAGVVLGPSVLSGLIPVVGEWVIPQNPVQGYLLEVVALIGVMLLLIVTGLETDLALIKRRIRVSFGVSAGGLSVTFAAGLALGFLIPEDLLVDPSQRTVFALFVATAMSIAAIPVLAKVLIDLGLMRRDIGQTMLASAMIDDITGWTLLGLVTALASAEAIGAGAVLETVGFVVIFVVATATVGNFLVDKGLTFVQERFRGKDMVLTFVVVLAFGWGAFTQALHLEPVIGAFAIGILFGRRPRLSVDVVHKLEAMALAVFAPVFFAVAGLKVNIGAILEPRLLLLTLAVIAVATFGKVTGAYLGARLVSKQGHWTALAYGSGLNARGAVEIIIATIGLSLGVLSVEMFSIIVVMAVVTSIMAPVALRYCLARVETGTEEQERLAKEDATRGMFTSRIRRMLVPVRPRDDVVGTQNMEALIAKRLSDVSETATTLFSVANAESKERANAYMSMLVTDVFDNPETTTRTVQAEDASRAILEEASHDYDLMMIGTPAMDAGGGSLFGPMLDDLVRLAPCPTIVVRGGTVSASWKPSKILVPMDGSPGARKALELAFAIAGDEGEVEAVYVQTPTLSGTRDFASDITTELQVLATQLDQRMTTDVVQASDVERGILRSLETSGSDLLVMGTSVRSGSTRLHLGPRVEYLAQNAPCPVVILNT